MKVIVVSGSVCAGKTRFSKRLAKKKGYKYVSLNGFIRENNLKGKYDRKKKTYEVDIKKLNRALIRFIKNSKKSMVIDGHLSHYLPKKYVDLCYIVKCDLKKLKGRLERRGYSKLKTDENLEAEIMDVCYNEAVELGHNVRVINNQKI